jgi:hypothetical protein
LDGGKLFTFLPPKLKVLCLGWAPTFVRKPN